MEYRTTKSVRIYPTREQYNHIKKINFACICACSWTLDALYANPDASMYSMRGQFKDAL